MSTSILTSVKKNLGILDDYTAFDDDILMHINTAFSTLRQLGIGPDVGFEIADKTALWDTFTGGDPKLNSVKTYIWIKVRLLFDPPTSSFMIESLKKQADEIEWRLNRDREDVAWVSPTPPAETLYYPEW